MSKQSRIYLDLPFIAIGVTAIVGAGVLSAFMAHASSRHVMWTVAYLILVVGVTQAVIGLAEHQSKVFRAPSHAVVTFLLHNIGSIAVIFGTVAGVVIMAVGGSLMVMAAMLVCLYSFGRRPTVQLEWSYVLVVALIFLSAPIGILLALR